LRHWEENKGESHEFKEEMVIGSLGLARNEALAAFYETVKFFSKLYFSRSSEFFPHNACLSEKWQINAWN